MELSELQPGDVVRINCFDYHYTVCVRRVEGIWLYTKWYQPDKGCKVDGGLFISPTILAKPPPAVPTLPEQPDALQTAPERKEGMV